MKETIKKWFNLESTKPEEDYQEQPEKISYLYVIYDAKAECRILQFESFNNALAARFFKDKMKNIAPSDRPDFRLYLIGSYGEKTLKSIAYEPVQEIKKGEEILMEEGGVANK